VYLVFRIFWKQLHFSTSLLHTYVFSLIKEIQNITPRENKATVSYILFLYFILYFQISSPSLYLDISFKKMFGTYWLGFKHGCIFYPQRTLPVVKTPFLGIAKWFLFHCNNFTEHCLVLTHIKIKQIKQNAETRTPLTYIHRHTCSKILQKFRMLPA